MLERMIKKLKEETVLVIVALGALFSMAAVPVNKDYLGYFNWSVLALLFSLMLVVSGLKKCGVFDWISEWLCRKTSSARGMALALVLLCFFTSMFVTNDVALITFVPFTILTLSMTEQQKRMPYIIVLQTVAANLGSMLTPVGNPQNLYLYSFYEMNPADFFRITVPVTVISFFLLIGLCLFVPKDEIREHKSNYLPRVDKDALALFLILFLVCLGTVFRFYHWSVMFAVVAGICILKNRKLFYEVDYGLLLTFICFFIFTGNLGKMEWIQDTLAGFLEGKELLLAALSSQVISNVPAAILLSGFTNEAEALVLGTDIGGLGTLVASLASLISYKAYSRYPGADKKKYMIIFTLLNVILLLLLLMMAQWMILS